MRRLVEVVEAQRLDDVGDGVLGQQHAARARIVRRRDPAAAADRTSPAGRTGSVPRPPLVDHRHCRTASPTSLALLTSSSGVDICSVYNRPPTAGDGPDVDQLPGAGTTATLRDTRLTALTSASSWHPHRTLRPLGSCTKPSVHNLWTECGCCRHACDAASAALWTTWGKLALTPLSQQVKSHGHSVLCCGQLFSSGRSAWRHGRVVVHARAFAVRDPRRHRSRDLLDIR